ncbi:MAG: hypothetical protein GX591_03855 [Planctomycetes bacterium]|nr:hypothetical protein [Planctomycetota bacterium]
MRPFEALTKRPVVVAVALAVALAVLAWLAWPSVRFRHARRKAMARYAAMQDCEMLNRVPAAEVRRLASKPSEGERAAAAVEGYLCSLPADAYALLPREGNHVDFESDVLKVRILGAGPLTGEFRKLPVGASALTDYFAKTDPYQIVVDAFNARPEDICRQKTQAALDKHLLLLLLKATLAPVGLDTHWEHIDTPRFRGIIAGDTSRGGIIVTLYLPTTQDFVDLILFPADGATMADVYDALSDLYIEPALMR